MTTRELYDLIISSSQNIPNLSINKALKLEQLAEYLALELQPLLKEKDTAQISNLIQELLQSINLDAATYATNSRHATADDYKLFLSDIILEKFWVEKLINLDLNFSNIIKFMKGLEGICYAKKSDDEVPHDTFMRLFYLPMQENPLFKPPSLVLLKRLAAINKALELGDEGGLQHFAHTLYSFAIHYAALDQLNLDKEQLEAEKKAYRNLKTNERKKDNLYKKYLDLNEELYNDCNTNIETEVNAIVLQQISIEQLQSYINKITSAINCNNTYAAILAFTQLGELLQHRCQGLSTIEIVQYIRSFSTEFTSTSLTNLAIPAGLSVAIDKISNPIDEISNSVYTKQATLKALNVGLGSFKALLLLDVARYDKAYQEQNINSKIINNYANAIQNFIETDLIPYASSRNKLDKIIHNIELSNTNQSNHQNSTITTDLVRTLRTKSDNFYQQPNKNTFKEITFQNDLIGEVNNADAKISGYLPKNISVKQAHQSAIATIRQLFVDTAYAIKRAYTDRFSKRKHSSIASVTDVIEQVAIKKPKL